MRKTPIFVVLFFLFFFLASPVGLIRKEVKAYQTISAEITHGEAFDFSGGVPDVYGNKVAVLKNTPGTLYMIFRIPGLNCNDYNTSIYNGVQKVGAGCIYDYDYGLQLYLNNLSFPETKDYQIAGYLEAKDGVPAESYFATGAVAQVYEEEGVQDASWLSVEETSWSTDIYTSPAIRSFSGKTIAGMRMLMGTFVRNEQQEFAGLEKCLNYSDTTCGFYEFLPVSQQQYAQPDIVYEQGFVFSADGEQGEFSFKVTTDQRSACSGVCQVRHNVEGAENITVYTRTPLGPGPPPPAPCVIFGYVKDELHDDVGVSGAGLRLDTKADADSGYVVGAANTNTASNGSWEFSFSPSECENIYGIRLQETNAGYCPGDGRDPDYPAGAWNTGANTVEWSNIPDSAGPITFYDQCQAITPTPTPPANIYCSNCGFYVTGPFQEDGSSTVSLDNTWTHYVPFAAPFNGLTDGVVVKAGNWGGAWRSIGCKVTNSDGSVDISVEGQSAAFVIDSGADWRCVDFATEFNLTAGSNYRLYCRGPDPWDSLYWIYDINQGGIIDGKTYAVCMEEVVPTPTPVPVGTVQGTIWDDANGDAVCNLGEKAFGGVAISYNVAEGETVSSNSSLACDQANYQFNNVTAERIITVSYDPDLLPGDYQPITAYQDSGYLSDGGTLTINFAVSDMRPLWFQVAGGGIWADSGPVVSVLSGEELIVDGDNQAGGLVTGSGSVDFGDGSLSENGWLVVDQSYSGPNYYVSYFENRFEGSEDVINVGGNEDSLSEVDGLSGCDATTCSFGVDSVVILRRNQTADFTIDRNIVVADGGFFAVLSKGGLIVEGGVAQLDGLYLTEGVFEIEDGDNQLIVNGSVADVGGGGILIKRNLGVDNKNNPGVIFNYRPDLLIRMPPELLKTRYEIEELLP